MSCRCRPHHRVFLEATVIIKAALDFEPGRRRLKAFGASTKNGTLAGADRSSPQRCAINFYKQRMNAANYFWQIVEDLVLLDGQGGGQAAADAYLQKPRVTEPIGAPSTRS